MAEVNSLIFGITREATPAEKEQIKELVKKCSVALFRQLNITLNTRGFSLGICTLEESEVQ